MFALLLQSIKFQPEWAHLPALVCSAIVGIVFGDMGVDAAESQLFVWGRWDGLDDQLRIGIRWLGLILEKGDKGVSAHVIKHVSCEE